MKQTTTVSTSVVNGSGELTKSPPLEFAGDIEIDLKLRSGDIAMLPMDMPTAAPQNLPVMIAQAAPADTDPNRLRTAGICFLAPNQPYMYSGANGLLPKVDARNYLLQFDRRDVPDTAPAKITLLESAKHGVLRDVTEADRETILNPEGGPLKPDAGLYAYLPTTGYLGKDKAVFLVDIAGVKVKVIYFLQGIDAPEPDTNRLCKRGYIWKISATTDPTGRLTVDGLQTAPSSLSATETGSLASAIPIYDNGLITFTMADLSGNALAQTVGNAITLDDNAAGKMDLLSVLLHEYGHALGIEHSHDAHDYMGATLAPGVRRLPSADELALMAQLVAEAKGELQAWLPDFLGCAQPDKPTLADITGLVVRV